MRRPAACSPTAKPVKEPVGRGEESGTTGRRIRCAKQRGIGWLGLPSAPTCLVREIPMRSVYRLLAFFRAIFIKVNEPGVRRQ